MTVRMRTAWFILGAALTAAPLLLLRSPSPGTTPIQGVRDPIVLPDNTGVIPAGAVTNLYPLIYQRVDVPMPTGRAGAVAAAGKTTLMITRQGALLRLQGDRFQALPVPLPFDLPMLEADLPIAKVRNRMGVYDLATRASGGDGWDLYITYAHHNASGCLTLRVATITLSEAALGGAETDAEWREIFASQPCIDTIGNKIALLGGGALTVTADDKLLVGVGTFALNGVNNPEVLAFLRSDANDYGKLIEIDLKSGASRHIAKGLRDPNGMVVGDDGSIWSTEHGPRGGDELNLVREGGDYGWPLSTFGTDYGQWDWPLDPDPGRHARFIPPAHTWVPSLGVSSALMIRGPSFENWRGDLIVSSLKAGHLYRLRLRDDHVVLMEPIYIGDRIRDVAEMADGSLLVLLDRFDFALRIVNGNQSEAAARFKSVPYQVAYCIGCHKVKPGDPGIAAPLTGLIGRPIAADGSVAWSEALRSAGGNWTRDRVAAFLEHPQRFAPGTTHPKLDLAPFRLFETVEWLASN